MVILSQKGQKSPKLPSPRSRKYRNLVIRAENVKGFFLLLYYRFTMYSFCFAVPNPHTLRSVHDKVTTSGLMKSVSLNPPSGALTTLAFSKVLSKSGSVAVGTDCELDESHLRVSEMTLDGISRHFSG